jgi:hypothetical protein
MPQEEEEEEENIIGSHSQYLAKITRLAQC